MKNSTKLAIAGSVFAVLTAASLIKSDRALAFFPECTQPNMENVGGNGNGPLTVAQALRLAEIRLTHPQATACSMIADYKVETYIQWPNPVAKSIDKSILPSLEQNKNIANLEGTTWCVPEDTSAVRVSDQQLLTIGKGSCVYVTQASRSGALWFLKVVWNEVRYNITLSE